MDKELQFLIYNTPEENVSVNAVIKDETIWLTQKAIEDLIERENTFTMTEFAASINEFLAFRKYDVLEGKGRISKKTADRKAVSEYVEFNKTQKIVSDFDKEVKKMLQGGEGGNE